ncbi:MAG: Acetyltransferase family [Verrucomicrobiota bacterium]
MIAETFSIRRAEESERRRITHLLLEGQANLDADIFVATESERETPVATSAVWFVPNRRFPEGANCTVYVLEPHRRRGIGRALVSSVKTVSQEIGARQLRTVPLEETSPGYAFSLACGFEFGAATISYEAPIENFAGVTRPVYRRLKQRGKIPKNASIIPLNESSRDEVCRLVLDHLGFSSQHTAERLRGTEHGFSQTLSRVALLDGKLVGALLITYQKALASVDATAVLPEHRHTWVNAALKYSAVEELIARGVERVRFSANSEQHRDTTKLVTRANARVLKTIRLGTLDLGR